MRLDELAKQIGAELAGDGATEVTAAATLEDAQAGHVSFLTNPKYASQLQTTKASAVVVSPNVKADNVALLKAKDPYYAFRQAVVALHGYRKHPFAGIHPKAHVDSTAVLVRAARITVVFAAAAPSCMARSPSAWNRPCNASRPTKIGAK